MKQVNKPVTQVLVNHKEVQSLEQFTSMLETIAKKLKDEGKFTFIQGEKEVVIQPSDQVKAEFKYEVKGDKHSFEIEFDWSPNKEIQKMKIM